MLKPINLNDSLLNYNIITQTSYEQHKLFNYILTIFNSQKTLHYTIHATCRSFDSALYVSHFSKTVYSILDYGLITITYSRFDADVGIHIFELSKILLQKIKNKY